MPKKFKEVYYTLNETDMQSLIAESKAGYQKATLELLQVFSNFLSKYIALLFHGRYNLTDYDIRRFVALFIKDIDARYRLVRNKLDSRSAKEINEAMRGIIYMTNRYCTEEDVQQTVHLAFLQCVERYQRKDDIPFSAYLYSYYFYLLKKMVDTFLIDQLGRKTYPLLDDSDYESSDADSEEGRKVGFPAPPLPGVEELIWAQEIDEFWVAGDTANPPFSYLTVQERQILKWRYVDVLIDYKGSVRTPRPGDIAIRLTEHNNTFREKTNKVKQKLAELLAEDLQERT